MTRPRVFLVHAPTPIERRPALDAIVGARVWIKRDDVTGGAESGNKLRKLELLLADARARGARAVITCGGIQSNHARATALACAALGLRAVLLLRVVDPAKARAEGIRHALAGNVLLDRLAGAEIRYVSHDEYRQRGAVLETTRQELEREGIPAYVIPEGGSNGLGSLGYVDAMRETKQQVELGLAGEECADGFDVVASACGSGGTAAGIALGAKKHDVAKETWAFAVCDDHAYFAKTIARISLEARGLDPSLPPIAITAPAGDASPADAARLVIDDRAKGPAYAVMDDEQRAFLASVTRRTGLVVDPVYTGKALFGLARAAARGEIARDARVLFVHTGGLPGLLAQGDDLASVLALDPADR